MKVCLVCTQGGHLTQLLQILDAFDGCEVFFVTCHSPRDEDVQKAAPAYFIETIGTNVFRMLAALLEAVRILLKERPDVIISTGSEIALPFFFLSKLFGIRTIFMETWSRIENLSKTGRILLRVADVFLVQWPQLLAVCSPRAQYKGAVI